MALGLFIVTLLAAVGVVFERWQEDQTRLSDEIEIAAVRLSESSDPVPPSISLSAGVDAYAVVFNDEGNVLGQSRELSVDEVDELRDEIWLEATSADLLYSADLASDGAPRIATGTACTDESVCDSVAVTVTEETLAPYLLARLGWVVGFALGAGVLGAVAARWLVGRSLRPVDRMRSELDGITASHITTADLERRVPVPDTGDELTRLGESMNGTLDRLGSAVSANERFVADAAHELRSPITGVKAALEVEQAKQPSGLLDASITELDRAARLVDDLLVLARRQSGTSRRVDVDLDDIARAATANLRVRRPDLTIELSLAPCRVRGDADELQRIVTNLLDNAAHYGNGHISVSTGSGPRPDQVYLRVADNGPGIAEEHRTTVFQRFARIDASRARATGGSGLGLAIAKELVEDHGGTIEVSAAELGGALFDITLPG